MRGQYGGETAMKNLSEQYIERTELGLKKVPVFGMGMVPEKTSKGYRIEFLFKTVGGITKRTNTADLAFH